MTIAEHKIALESKHMADIEAAVERQDRAGSKGQVKGSSIGQNAKGQNWEAQALKWKEAGYIPAEWWWCGS
jgi:hypothetical protein